jgi:hypothetical protein
MFISIVHSLRGERQLQLERYPDLGITARKTYQYLNWAWFYLLQTRDEIAFGVTVFAVWLIPENPDVNYI